MSNKYKEFDDFGANDGSRSEDVTIVDKKTLYDKYSNVEYLVYTLKKKLGNGSIVQYCKATRFFRLVRVSKDDQQNTKMMEVHTDIIRSAFSTKTNLIVVIANIMNPEPLGLIYCFGVQATGSSPAEAIEECRKEFAGLLASYQGTHRTCHIVPLQKKEMDAITKRLGDISHSYVVNVQGIPQTKQSSGSPSKSCLPQQVSNTEEQMEQFIGGLVTDDFIFMLMATPLNEDYLRKWLVKSLEEQNEHESKRQGSKSISFSIGIPMSFNCSNGTNTGTSRNSSVSNNHSISTNHNEGTSTNENISEGTNTGWNSSINKSDGTSNSIGSSKGTSTSENHGTSWNEGNTVGGNVQILSKLGGLNYSHNNSNGGSDGYGSGTNTGTNESTGENHSNGTSSGLSGGESFNQSKGSGTSISDGTGTSDGTGNSLSNGLTSGKNFSRGMSGGLSPSISFGKNYQWQDMTQAYICELLGFQNDRLKQMLNGDGGFFTDCYISCNNPETQKKIESLVTTTWINPDGKIDIIHGDIPQRQVQAKLAMHMQAMTPCLEKSYNKNGGSFYKYATILRSSEISAFTHPPRISVGGLEAAMDDRPKFRVPADRQNKEILVGNVISSEVFSYEQAEKNRGLGYVTDLKYSIGNNELAHLVIDGQAGSGKSVLARRLVHGLYNNCFTEDRITHKKSRKRILILDPKGEWRLMGKVVPAGEFKFYSIANPDFYPLKMNLLRCPKNIRPYEYLTMFTEHFCAGYGLLDRAIAEIRGAIYELYDEVHAFDTSGGYDPYRANELTKNITLADVYNKLKQKCDDLQKTRDSHGVEALNTYLTRLDMFNKPESTEYIMFCNRGGQSIEDVLGEDDVTVIESNGLPKNAQSFFFVLMMDGMFRYAQGQGSKGFYSPGQYETFIVLEEANTVLISSNSTGDDSNDSLKRVSEVIDQSRSYGLFIWTITQKIASMPNSVIANSGLVFIGRTTAKNDIDTALTMMGYGNGFHDIAYNKFVPRMPVGEFICTVKKGEQDIQQIPTLVKVKPLDVDIPDDAELDIIVKQNIVERMRRKHTD